MQKSFGRQLPGVRSHLSSLGLKVTGASHAGLQASAERPQVLHLTVAPARARRHLMAPGHDEAVKSETLRVALVFKPETSMDAVEEIYARADAPYVDPVGNAWWPSLPDRMAQKRIRLSFVCNLADLLVEEEGLTQRLTTAVSSMVDRLARDVDFLRPSD